MTPPSAAPVEVVRAVYAALAAHDLAAVLTLTDPLVTIDQSDFLPWGGQHVGYDGLRTFTAAVATHLDSAVEVTELFAAGDRVVQVGRTRGHARSTGRAFDAAEVHVWRVADGKVVALQVYADTDALRAALGLDDDAVPAGEG